MYSTGNLDVLKTYTLIADAIKETRNLFKFINLQTEDYNQRSNEKNVSNADVEEVLDALAIEMCHTFWSANKSRINYAAVQRIKNNCL